MQVNVSFYSYCKELTGCSYATEVMNEGSTLGELIDQLSTRFPKLATMRKSMLMAVGVDYQDRTYVLKNGEEVSLFPPVQGG